MPRPSLDDVTLDAVECIASTDKALLVYVPDLGDKVWLPKSQILEEDSDNLDVGEVGTLVVSAWIAKEKGLM